MNVRTALGVRILNSSLWPWNLYRGLIFLQHNKETTSNFSRKMCIFFNHMRCKDVLRVLLPMRYTWTSMHLRVHYLLLLGRVALVQALFCHISWPTFILVVLYYPRKQFSVRQTWCASLKREHLCNIIINWCTKL